MWKQRYRYIMNIGEVRVRDSQCEVLHEEGASLVGLKVRLLSSNI